MALKQIGLSGLNEITLAIENEFGNLKTEDGLKRLVAPPEIEKGCLSIRVWSQYYGEYRTCFVINPRSVGNISFQMRALNKVSMDVLAVILRFFGALETHDGS